MSQDHVRDWFLEMHNQLSRMASELGLDELREAAWQVDLAYRSVYPAQVVRLSVPTGPGQRERMSALLDLALASADEHAPALPDRGRQLERETPDSRIIDI